MGVPKFYRWISQRYPAILSDWIKYDVNDNSVSEDGVNPRIDALYLDMNGMIHNCSHNNSDLVTVDDSSALIVAQRVCEEINYLVSTLVRPIRLIYLAIDGVAPRAKLNQQRSRRFRSAQERASQISKLQDTNESALSALFDSNCITPGTEFMADISKNIIKYVEEQMVSNDRWKHLEVIFSGSEVPGEGEHKIISYIRDMKARGSLPPNTRHCIYGADADVIMLGLATHEPFMLVLRESPAKKGRKSAEEINHSDAENLSEQPNNRYDPSRKNLEYIRVHILREYLLKEFTSEFTTENRSRFNQERLIDDFVFLTFLVGNDFLPHLPAIDIGDQAFDVIFDAYRQALKEEHGYLVAAGELNYQSLERILDIIATTEAVKYQEKEWANACREYRHQQKLLLREQRLQRLAEEEHISIATANSNGDSTELVSDLSVEQQLNSSQPSSGGQPESVELQLNYDHIERRSYESLRENYYREKFQVDLRTAEGEAALSKLVSAYLTGLSWCLKYYTTGCVSWSWFYPYHYGIFLSDMRDLADHARDIHFDLHQPLQPFQQLLACLPPASSHLLPASYHYLMAAADSPIVDYYPTEFMIDFNGKKNAYEAVILLPFIDLDRLLAAERGFCPEKSLSDAERARNSFGEIHVVKSTRSEGLLHSTCEYSLQPGECFAAALIPGTLDALPGYPTLSNLMALHTFGSARAINNAGRALGRRGRGRGSGNGRRGGGRAGRFNSSSFPMLGRVGGEKIITLKLSVESNANTVLFGLAQQIHAMLPAFRAYPTTEYALSCRLNDFLHQCGFHQLPENLDAIVDAVLQQVTKNFAKISLSILPQVTVWPAEQENLYTVALTCGVLGVDFQQLQSILTQQLILKVAGIFLPTASLAFAQVFPTVIEIGCFEVIGQGLDVENFVVWLNGELHRFCSMFSILHFHRIHIDALSDSNDEYRISSYNLL